ncbi:branched-chain amino acid aminotransferase [Demequina capsici]|uniref:branched-chain-amino-acid transaminase n=1 Tax=Demequina capsici TaxID=3075620 RepID=A0AA96JF73_9MICO|nr:MULTISPECIES: branched-chain amino acid aminotransferase [unclassified Demequina]WNM23621.1 branched-chain amino acid aminotransferase [Demequina sp. OYTSA14]WNM26459.1 branched-chain amino acid aminotransferase [Demequina sp. PMTSA13]
MTFPAIPTGRTLSGDAFPLTPNPHPATDTERAALMTDPVFGKVFTDHMARATWSGGSWGDRGVVPLEPIPMHPGAAVLHYSQQVFEGLKAYRHADGSIHLFRPTMNAERMIDSAYRLAMPPLPVDDFLAACAALVQADQRWVPEADGAALYLRPYLMATETSLLVQPSDTYDLVVTASPVGAYMGGGGGVSIWVSRGYHRANDGGTGEAKTGGNYAASMLPQQQAKENGCGQVLFLDAKEDRYVEELGGMNLMVVLGDGSVATPRLSGTILPGITRDSVMTLLADAGRPVRERDIEIDEIREGVASGAIVELFAVGTAAVVTPIGELRSDDFALTVGDGKAGPVGSWVKKELTDIQYGRTADDHGWLIRVV